MKLQQLALVTTLCVVGCASFNETHRCYSPYKFNGGNYKNCLNKKENRLVLFDIDNEKIISENALRIQTLPIPGIIFVDKIGEVEKLYGEKLSKRETIDGSKGVSPLGARTKFESNKNYNLFYSKEGLKLIDSQTGNFSENTITKFGDDQNHKTLFNEIIPSKMEYAFKDVLIRRSAWENRLPVYKYQLYDKNANPVLENEVTSKGTSLNLNNGEYILFKQMDEEGLLLRPIAEGIEDKFFEGINVEGIILLDEEIWKTRKLEKNKAILPSFKHFIIVTKKDKNKSYQLSSYLINKKDSREKQLEDFKAALTPNSSNDSFVDLEWVMSVYKYKNNEFYEQKRPLLISANGKAYISDRYGELNISYKNKADYYAKTAEMKSMFAKYKSDVENREKLLREMRESARKTDLQIAEHLRQERQRRQDIKDRAAAENRAAKDAAWSGVAQKLQDAASASKKKADCIRRRTKTKKDYLDKKQDWYQTGGC